MKITETQIKSKPRLCLTENMLLPVLSFQTGENLGNSLQAKRFQKKIYYVQPIFRYTISIGSLAGKVGKTAFQALYKEKFR
jgi:hypothetical protein